jgi:AraC-like DNA-binding protein
MGMSRMQLHRKLKSLLGVSTTEFLRKERIKMAASLLKKPNITIAEIAYSVGFNDVSYFIRCFKEIYNCTPSEYQENN